MASGGLTCVKCITIFCNLLFALTGLLILIVGVTVQLNYAHYSNFVSDHIWTVPIILIIVGATKTFTYFLGCCGSLTENGCMILCFSILAIIIFFSEIGLGVACYLKHAALGEIMEGQFNSSIREYNYRKENRDAWSLLQSEMDCCGTFGPKDWETVFHNATLPPACCAVINLNEAQECTVIHSHAEGCLNKLLTLIDSKTVTLASVVLGVAGIQLLTILFACCLFRSFRRA
ncbi:CD63 antigen [Eurosta solidaginis]|uniref:CD63 antigen n=1 Tax=Eurosta solidaginis TaxID=178769 RepID=UPI003530A891